LEDTYMKLPRRAAGGPIK